jgi:hypothetical protein
VAMRNEILRRRLGSLLLRLKGLLSSHP